MADAPANPFPLNARADDQTVRLARLAAAGVEILDPRQTFIGADVDPARIRPGAVLHPGTRLEGARTFIGAKAQVGTEGPATLRDGVLGPGAEVASGFLHGAVLLSGAKAGANSHFRPGTLLEEEASTAHAVGLKQTILMAFVTCGSLINLCDVLVSGGRSRKDHTEIGSGFIHFNFTPWGKHGDKATASLIGTAVDGVFLDRDKIFLGGLSGIVGPQSIGFGSLTIAGQVIREPVGEGEMVSGAMRETRRPWSFGRLDGSARRRKAAMAYLAQLAALKAWYGQVRLPRAHAAKSDRGGDQGDDLVTVLHEALATIDDCISERIKRYNAFAEERGAGQLAALPEIPAPCPVPAGALAPGEDHISWVKGLEVDTKNALKGWLGAIARQVEEEALNALSPRKAG